MDWLLMVSHVFDILPELPGSFLPDCALSAPVARPCLAMAEPAKGVHGDLPLLMAVV